MTMQGTKPRDPQTKKKLNFRTLNKPYRCWSAHVIATCLRDWESLQKAVAGRAGLRKKKERKRRLETSSHAEQEGHIDFHVQVLRNSAK